MRSGHEKSYFLVFAQVSIEEKNIASGFWNKEAGATRVQKWK